MIIKALRDCAHNKSSTAKMGIARSTLYYKMKVLGSRTATLTCIEIGRIPDHPRNYLRR